MAKNQHAREMSAPEKTSPPSWDDEIFSILQEAEDFPSPTPVGFQLTAEKSKALADSFHAAAAKADGWARRWFAWLCRMMTEEDDGTESGEDEDKPAWLERIGNDVAQAHTAAINFKALAQKRPTQSTALTLGELVGHQQAFWSPGNPGIAALLAHMEPPAAEYFKAVFDALRPQQLALVQRALAVAVQRPYEEARQFVRGYSLAMQKGTLAEDGRPTGETYTTKIYATLLTYSGFVEQLQNVRELHEWLQMVLGKNVVGDIKRVEKICERIGLSFRGRGRPTRKENPTR